MLIQNLLRCGA